MYLNPKQRKEIVLIHFTLWFLNQSQVDDKKLLKQIDNKKYEKKLKEIISIRKKIINPLSNYIVKTDCKLFRKQKVQLDKQFMKLKNQFLHKMKLFNNIKKRKNIDEIYVEFDFISYLILKIMYENKFDISTYEIVNSCKKLIDYDISHYNKMSQEEITIIERFMKNLVQTFIEG